MKFISTLSEAELISLQFMSRKHPLAWSRVRANAVVLSHHKIPLQIIASIHGVSRQTASLWLKKWEKSGLCGLVDLPGRGRN